MRKSKVFLDASVLFSAAYSASGAARELFRLAQIGRLTLLTNEFALDETRRNLRAKVPHALPLFEQLIQSEIMNIVGDPRGAAILEAAAYTELKDAVIVAGALATRANFLVTYDRKHLINPPEVAENSGLEIMLPATLLERLRRSEE